MKISVMLSILQTSVWGEKNGSKIRFSASNRPVIYSKLTTLCNKAFQLLKKTNFSDEIEFTDEQLFELIKIVLAAPQENHDARVTKFLNNIKQSIKNFNFYQAYYQRKYLTQYSVGEIRKLNGEIPTVESITNLLTLLSCTTLKLIPEDNHISQLFLVRISTINYTIEIHNILIIYLRLYVKDYSDDRRIDFLNKIVGHRNFVKLSKVVPRFQEEVRYQSVANNLEMTQKLLEQPKKIELLIRSHDGEHTYYNLIRYLPENEFHIDFALMLLSVQNSNEVYSVAEITGKSAIIFFDWLIRTPQFVIDAFMAMKPNHSKITKTKFFVIQAAVESAKKYPENASECIRKIMLLSDETWISLIHEIKKYCQYNDGRFKRAVIFFEMAGEFVDLGCKEDVFFASELAFPYIPEKYINIIGCDPFDHAAHKFFHEKLTSEYLFTSHNMPSQLQKILSAVKKINSYLINSVCALFFVNLWRAMEICRALETLQEHNLLTEENLKFILEFPEGWYILQLLHLSPLPNFEIPFDENVAAVLEQQLQTGDYDFAYLILGELYQGKYGFSEFYDPQKAIANFVKIPESSTWYERSLENAMHCSYQFPLAIETHHARTELALRLHARQNTYGTVWLRNQNHPAFANNVMRTMFPRVRFDFEKKVNKKRAIIPYQKAEDVIKASLRK